MKRSYSVFKTVLIRPCSVGARNVLSVRSCQSLGAENSKSVRETNGLSACDIVREYGIPIQRVSLSRGLALNRFEKDFFIYPEYSDTDTAENILKLVSALKEDIKAAASHGNSIAALWDRYKLSSYAVPKEYGGVNMCYKDLLALCEGLGSYWRFYIRFEQTHLAASLILLFGNDQQKSQYLPQIASGAIRPAIGFPESEMDPNLELVASLCGSSSDKQKLIATEHFINGSDADLLFVFSKRDENEVVCYLVDRKNGDIGTFEVGTKTSIFGRSGLEINSLGFKQQTIEANSMLGKPEDGKKIAQEVLIKRITFGAAVVGYFIRILQYNAAGELAHLVTQLALNTYVLESMCYYIGGLHDEELALLVDVEEAIIHKYARDLLSKAISSTADIIGVSAVTSTVDFDGLLNDMIAALLLSSTELDLKNFVASQVIISYANTNANRIKQWRTFDKRLYDRIFGHVEKAISFHDPKLQHFIAEHVHPSLKEACSNLEYTMWRLEALLDLLLSKHGKGIISDYNVLRSISKVTEYNLGMVTTIARSSRSYSIGLRNSDLEISWAQLYCSEAANMSMAELRKLYDCVVDFHFERLNYLNSKIGQSVVDNGGYCVESPVTRNW
uniref:Acyl-CoA dehydrogenase/oxidase N-terminal domain-containing protein n=1 Tax=Setaria digitata TaxID=48799 RepID=A0A915PUW7_9BILA